MAVGHQADLIKTFFGDGGKWGIKIEYSLETQPLSTMGPLKLIKNLPDNFLIMNGDILTDFDYNKFYLHHVNRKNIFTIAGYQRNHQLEYGILGINAENKLISFEEKPNKPYFVSMGIYMASKEILQYIPQGKAYGFDALMADLIKSGNLAEVYKHEGYWLDIGNPSDYIKAIEEFETRKPAFNI